MKVIFLDFDGVLNSAASFNLEDRIRRRKPRPQGLPPVNETLCHICTSNFQYILDHFPEVKIVISSTWRELFDLEWLKKKLSEYNIDSSRVIDRTPVFYDGDRGTEINKWLSEHPEVTKYVIIDDNHIGGGIGDESIVRTSWNVGMTLPHAVQAIEKLGGSSHHWKLNLE